MPEFNLRDKFPSLRPIKNAPSMHLINGCGTRVVGRRDADGETGSYVTTLCFCLLFIPIVALRAYRVIPSPRGGWYFLGVEPLSVLARTWNILLGLGTLTIGVTLGVNAYMGRPEYIAHQRMAHARQLAAEGQLADAAAICADFIIAGNFETAAAREELKELIDRQCEGSSGTQAAGVFAAAARVTTHGGAYSASDLMARGVPLADRLGTANPGGALALLDVVRPLALDPRDIDKARLPLLQKAVAANPGDMPASIALASLLVDQNQFDEAGKLLLPFRNNLGNGEGARVLGLILVHDEKFDEACALLLPYVKPRLEALHAAEKAADDTVEMLWRKEIDLLRNDKGPPEFYQRLEAAPNQDQKDAIVSEYVRNRLKGDPRMQQVQDALERESGVVPVVLELGMAMLERAQAAADPGERKKQLEATQEIFLSIKSAAGESDQYRLFLGQVYYWLGKQTEGKGLFDEYLASKGNSPQATFQIAATLRSLGIDTQARSMAEDAYTRATRSEERFDAARLRSMLSKDEDDEIEWLRKSDLGDPHIRTRLETTLGYKAQALGHDDEAAGHYRAALEIARDLPRDQSTLNQISLMSDALYRATGDTKDLERSVDAIQQAVALNQSDSVLLYNAGVSVMEASMVDIIGKEIDLHALRSGAAVDMLEYLYQDDAGRELFAKRVAAHPGIAKALAYFDKVMVLSPKNARSYASAVELQSFLRNENALQSIEQHIRAARLDTEDQIRNTQEFLQGKDDANNLTKIAGALQRSEVIVAATRAAGGPTYACALCAQAGLLLQRDLYDGSTDPDKVMQLAEEADKTAPSSATRTSLLTASLFRAFKQLRASNPEFNAFATQYYRPLGQSVILAFLVRQNGPLGKAIAAHPDFRRAVELMKNDDVSFRTAASGFTWAIFSVVDPAIADVESQNLRTVPRHALLRSIAIELNPASASSALTAAWEAQAVGNDQQAQTILTRAAQAGAKIPSMH